MSHQQDAIWMSRAIELAKKAMEQQEVPVGAVLVQDNTMIGWGANSPIGCCDATAHAEINALRMASKAKQNYRLPETELYVTLEPCAMCAGAIVHARVKRVIIATKEPRAGAAGSVFDLLNHPKMNHRCQVEFGLMQNESASLLQSFFKARR